MLALKKMKMRKTSKDRREQMKATLKSVGTLISNAGKFQNAKLAQQKAMHKLRH